jgi:hypothetical protein
VEDKKNKRTVSRRYLVTVNRPASDAENRIRYPCDSLAFRSASEVLMHPTQPMFVFFVVVVLNKKERKAEEQEEQEKQEED